MDKVLHLTYDGWNVPEMYGKVFDEKAISKNYAADRTCFANISRPLSRISISRLCASMHAEYNLTATKILT